MLLVLPYAPSRSHTCFTLDWASLVDQLVKNPPAMWETWVLSLGWEDTLEKGWATHSSILAWRIPWIIHGVTELDMTERLSLSLDCIIEGKKFF